MSLKKLIASFVDAYRCVPVWLCHTCGGGSATPKSHTCGGGFATPKSRIWPHLDVCGSAKNSLHRFGAKAPHLGARDIVFMRETVRFLSVLTFK